MQPIVDYDQYDGLALGELVRQKKVTALELVETAISRIEKHNPAVNAVIHKMYDHARAAAQQPPDGLFSGVPFLLKDLIGTVAGVPTASGNRLLKDRPASQDSELVKRYKNAGLLILGKTNTPEFGLTPFTEPEAFGATRNPWDLSRTSGGSSGGSAAAVASGMVPMASGGDGGGSIRIPASCCGLFGLKPTRGRVPTGPENGELWRGFVVEHVITRTVRDSAAMLDAISGPDPGTPYIIAPPQRPYLQELGAEPGPLRIAFTEKPFFGTSVHPDCKQGLEKTVELLRVSGHTLVEAAPEINGAECAVAFLTILSGEMRADLESTARLYNRKPRLKDFEPSSFALGLIGKATSASAYARAARVLQKAARSVGRFFEEYDLLLTPTLAAPPVPVGSLQPKPAEKALMKVIGSLRAGWLLNAMDIIKPIAAQTFEFIPYTPLFNITGQPAMSVPLYWNAEGLPIGMQFVGKWGDEATLFRLAAQLEKIQPWFQRRPTAI
jgi:amidase